ncbi:MAG: hypothetical protein A3G32_09490 [Deltaproteobacteria bacterium RIFCSPLOWO2_12_FULL_40_28]|nr:MAG: hypothetical protein A3C45_07760 [Deltaproteobacteria bacterium RIFCSPHIGHO2_02_FULL_40_28]OGQ20515.1 MAG: hypothetical protein A3E27_02550 [Deltaproteobacteria bacterium RIFCSPHIGHO2_12_FULL_40_32]OGQ41166.1 MAG: hypothetical protein A3I69_07785 [Deltaproteobacteria bacterium RIFCSPLOWO2_02_FULL_40_36]OGQ55128.1 MAG: hypothetical protein A3G32_09490 [Deltaproteobacteria bacterium RIFCSPLOWO2_12_FULL_40_28]
MKALVIGGTGIIGNHVVRCLLKRGIDVRIFSRGKTPSKNLEDLKIEIFQGDLMDENSLHKAVKGCEWVFHTAAYYPKSAFGFKEHLRQALGGINTVLKVIAQNPVERFVFTSSLTTIGKPAYYGVEATEKDAYNFKTHPHPYFACKIAMENRVLEEAKKGMPAIVVNPTGGFGPYEMKEPRLCLIPQLVKRKIPAVIPGFINVVDMADVATGHVLAALKGRIGERYILGGQNTTVQDLMKLICEVANVPPPRFTFPLPLTIAVAGSTEWLFHYLFNKTSPFSLLAIRFVQYAQNLSSAKAIEELGYHWSPMKPCLQRALEWFRFIGYC